MLPCRDWWAWSEDPASGGIRPKATPRVLQWGFWEIQAPLYKKQHLIHWFHQNHRKQTPQRSRAFLDCTSEERPHLQRVLRRLVLHTGWELPHPNSGHQGYRCQWERNNNIHWEWSQGKICFSLIVTVPPSSYEKGSLHHTPILTTPITYLCMK